MLWNEDDILKRLMARLPELSISILIDKYGSILSHVPKEINKDILYSYSILALIMELSNQSSSDKILLGEMDQFYLKGSNGYYLVVRVDSSRLLIIRTTSEVRLGLVFLDIMRTVEKIKKISYQLPKNDEKFGTFLEKKVEELISLLMNEMENLEIKKMEYKKQIRLERNNTEEKIKKNIPLIEKLIQDKEFSMARSELNGILKVAKENRFKEIIKWTEEKLKLCDKLEKERLRLERINQIKKTVLDLGTKYTRLEVREIIEKSDVNEEELIVKTVTNMIDNKEIYAEYFSSSNSISFNQQANIDEIDKLMAIYKEWEEKKVEKK